ncbi:MAG: sulfotransferase [Proteobacteria bacterium]|nr:sulfotransferase [Pseudomonadota bacterium]MBU4295738.1 sulfotransferase [Pseudomonadota bacterium]MCG2747157.1 sulfotransferase [Desulfobulbaceae bacterium]
MTHPAPFIVGVGRSGTTLLRLMLDAHPQLAIPSETHFLAGILEHPPEGVGEFIAMLTAAHTWGDFHLDAMALAADMAAHGPFVLAEAVRVFYLAYAARFGKSRWGDKSPPYVQYIAALHSLLPEARFIHMIRDGRDVALSFRDKWFGPAGQGMEASVVFWRDRIINARLQAASLPAGVYFEVRFEDLLAEPEAVLRRVCQFLDLPWSEAMLDYHRNADLRLGEMGDRTDGEGNVLIPREQRLSIHKHTMRPPDPSQAGKWRAAFTPAEIDVFHLHAGDLLAELGYDV